MHTSGAAAYDVRMPTTDDVADQFDLNFRPGEMVERSDGTHGMVIGTPPGDDDGVYVLWSLSNGRAKFQSIECWKLRRLDWRSVCLAWAQGLIVTGDSNR